MSKYADYAEIDPKDDRLSNALKNLTKFKILADMVDFSAASTEYRELESRAVSPRMYNPGVATLTYNQHWEDKVSFTKSVSVTATAEAGIEGVAKASLAVTASVSWTTEHTKGEAIGVTLPPGTCGQLFRTPVIFHAKGDFALPRDKVTAKKDILKHFYKLDPCRFHSEFSGPATKDGSAGSIVLQSRVMTEAEKKRFNKGNYENFERESPMLKLENGAFVSLEPLPDLDDALYSKTVLVPGPSMT